MEPTPLEASLTSLDALRHSEDWARWHTLTADAPPFLSPEFFVLNQPLVTKGQALVAVARQAGELVGALPLVLEGDNLTALRTDCTPDFDLTGGPAGLDAIWKMLVADERWRTLTLSNIPCDSPLAVRLPGLARERGFPTALQAGARHPIFRLPAFEQRVSHRFLVNLRRCERKAGTVELERLTTPSRAAFEDAIAIEAMAWKGAAGTSIDADPRATHLYHALTRLFGRRQSASLCFLRIGGKRVATLLAVEDKQTFYALKIGYDPSVAALSPGHLLVWKAARDAEERGLERFDFSGREDEWKHRWTSLTHDHVSLVIYRRSVRGLAMYVGRELLAPTIRQRIPSLRTPLREGCQRTDIIGTHTIAHRIRARLHAGFGIRTRVRRAFSRGSKKPSPWVGAPSQFAVGSWVRVLDEARLRATLDEQNRLRGLPFVPVQWESCGRVYQVVRQVRRLRDDRGRFRAVSRTVLLDDSTCGSKSGEPTGCGRHCPLMYRDEWLEPAAAPAPELKSAAPKVRHARIRELDHILSGLDLHGRRDGVTFMPEMAAYAGQRHPVTLRLPVVFEYDHWVKTPRPVYLLGGLHCSGAVMGDKGPCERGCALLWHDDWLQLEDAVEMRSSDPSTPLADT